ncbi:MAG: START domain-containing protein [Bacteroidota bacterium]|nr:START domain-containing protein [Bacteroidota bacterium]
MFEPNPNRIKKLIFIFTFILFSLAYALAQKEWSLTKNTENIQVYVRDYPGLSIKELKTIAVFECNAQTLVQLISDIPEQAAYQFGCKQSYVLQKINRFEQIYYQELYVPWPFENRDGAFRQRVEPSKHAGEFFIYANSEPQFLPNKKGFVRVPFMKAKWHITQINPNLCKAEYVIAVDPGGVIPLWLINLFIDKAPLESVRGMRKSLLKERYLKR